MWITYKVAIASASICLYLKFSAVSSSIINMFGLHVVLFESVFDFQVR